MDRVAVVAFTLALGAGIGRLAAPKPAPPQPVIRPAAVGKLRVRVPEDPAVRRAVREAVDKLKSDSSCVYVQLEDVVVEPASHAGRVECMLAMVNEFKPRERRAVLTTSWGGVARFEADLGGLPTETQKQILRLTHGPSWSVFKGRWRPRGDIALCSGRCWSCGSSSRSAASMAIWSTAKW